MTSNHDLFKAFDKEIVEPKTILCFGDSNTWGMAPDGSGRLPFLERWPNRLEQLLNQMLPDDQSWVVIEQGLNSRTWVIDDPLGAVNYGGEYSCNGRKDLLMIMHSCKPLDLVILALGCNDCKNSFNLSPEEITAGAKLLIRDIRLSCQCGPRGSNQPPDIVLMTPGLIQSTPEALAWGFKGAPEKARQLPSLYRRLAEQESVLFFDVQTVADPSPLDGVHFDCNQQHSIAAGLAALIAAMPS